MNISLNQLCANSLNFLEAKNSDGLIPLETRVALVAIACLAIVTLGYFVYHYFCAKPIKIGPNESVQAPAKIDSAAKNGEPLKNDNEDKAANKNENDKVQNNPAQEKSDSLSETQIAVKNADKLRGLVDRYPTETISRDGQWRVLYLDRLGNIQGIDGPDHEKVWLTQAGTYIPVRITLKKMFWEPSDKPAFTWNGNSTASQAITKIIEKTLHELNQLALGAYHLAKKDQKEDDWLKYLSNTKDYTSEKLLSEAEALAEQLQKAQSNYVKDEKKQENQKNTPILKTVEAREAKRKKTVAERLKDNIDDAIKQQAKEYPKGFKIVEGPLPVKFEVQKAQFLWAMQTVELKGETIWIESNEVGTASCQGSREAMEDADIVIFDKIILQNAQYPFKLLGVFDGHGGPGASDFVAKNLAAYLKKEIASLCNDTIGLTDDRIFQALKNCCEKLDADYTGEDGTTATFSLIINDKMWVANVGDSRTILVWNGIYQVSEDAKPTMEKHKDKIEKLGGFVANSRVNDILAVARAIGDKNIVGKNDVCCVLPNPKITTPPYLPGEGYLVLACDGLYDVATTKEIGEAIQMMYQQGVRPEEMAKRLVYSAIQRGSKDNVSVVVMKL